MDEWNWAGNHRYRADIWHRPTSIDQLQAVVAAADRVGVIGSRHSFNGLGDAAEVIDLHDLPTWVHHVEGADEITCAGHITYAALAPALEHHGLALANLASLPHISVAGAIATGTHGSGSANGNLSTAVRQVGLIDAAGNRTLLGPDAVVGLDAGVVAMGLLGIVEKVSLAVEPAYEAAQFVYEGLTWDAVLDSFPALFASAYSVSLFSRLAESPDQVWLKFRAGDDRLDHHRLDHRRDDHRRDDHRRDGRPFFGGRAAVVDRHPIIGLPADAATEQRGQLGPWHERLPHFRASFQPSAGEEIQSEFFVALADGAAALEALRRIGGELADVLLVNEVRTVAADRLWMSPAYRRDSAAFHFTWRRDATAVDRAVALVETALAPFDPRPHWGKVFHADAFDLPSLFERFGDFRRLLEQADPERCFANEWSSVVLDW